MNEILAIVMLAGEQPASSRMAMASVVHIQGSSYRRPGARMLITDNGKSAGMISGGCLESDVKERARLVMATGLPVIATYDSTAPEDIVFGLGLGCNGIVKILIEPINPSDENGPIAILNRCLSERRSIDVATVLSGELLGARSVRWPNGQIDCSFDSSVCPDLHSALIKVVASGRTVSSDTCPWKIVTETVTPPTQMVVFGAGDDAIPLVALASNMGWNVTISDHRTVYANKDRFPWAANILHLRPELLHGGPIDELKPESVLMIMTHNYLHDKELLRSILPTCPAYVGLLGPKARRERLLTDLRNEGLKIDDGMLDALHGPAGLDIGAETPDEIALSIIAEMKAVVMKRSGGSLRDRNSGIHADSLAG